MSVCQSVFVCCFVPVSVCLCSSVVLSQCLSVCLCSSVVLSQCMSVCLCSSVVLSQCLSVCLCSSVVLSQCLSVCVRLLFCLSVCLSVCVRLLFCLSVCLSVCVRLLFCLSVCLSVCVRLLFCLTVCLAVSCHRSYFYHFVGAAVIIVLFSHSDRCVCVGTYVWICLLCKLPFRDRSSYETHQSMQHSMHHSYNKQSCAHCGRQFAQCRQFQLHKCRPENYANNIQKEMLLQSCHSADARQYIGPTFVTVKRHDDILAIVGDIFSHMYTSKDDT